MTKKLRFFAYSRVSSNRQKYDGTIKTQIYTIENYLADHPEIEVIKWYKEEKSGRMKVYRELYEEMKNDVSELKPDGIIVSTITRVSRSVKQIYDFYTFIIDNKLNFISLKESQLNISNNEEENKNNPFMKFNFSIAGIIGELNADITRQNLSEGYDREYALHPERFGRPKKVFTKKDITLMKDMYAKGIGSTNIGKMFNVSHTKIINTLKENNVTIRTMEQAKAFNKKNKKKRN